MKTKIRAALALAVCVAVLGVLLAYVTYTPPQTAAEGQAAAVYAVVDRSPADILAVKVENAAAAYAILNSQSGLEMVSTAAGNYDAAQMRALVYTAGHISGSRKVTDAQTFGNYGLSTPRATVTLYLSDQTELRYRVLADHALEQSTYLYAEWEQAVYLIPREVAALFLRTQQDFISHTIFPLRAREDYAEIRQIELAYHGNGRDYTVQRTDQGDYLTAPVRLRITQERMTADLLDPLLQLYADEIVATQADLAQYGLDNPALTVTLTVGQKTYRAAFVREQDGHCLMADPAGDVVYRLEDAPLLMLLQDYSTLLGSGVVYYTAGELTDVTLTNGGQSLFMPVSGSGDTLSMQLGAQTLPKTLQTQLLEALNGLTPVGELAENVTGEPVFQFTARLRTGAQETVALIPVAQGMEAVSINGTSAFVTDGDALLTLQAVWDALIALQ